MVVPDSGMSGPGNLISRSFGLFRVNLFYGRCRPTTIYKRYFVHLPELCYKEVALRRLTLGKWKLY